jgi:hypothetical protein
MGWIETEDGARPWFRCGSQWTGCRGGHPAIAELKTCFARGYRQAAGEHVWPCTWLVEGRYDDGSAYAYECGALAREIEGGYQCEAGHQHFDMEYMARHGMAYASDEEEAAALARRGVFPLLPDGKAAFAPA